MSHRCLGCSSPVDPSFRACPHCGDVITEFARRYSAELLDGKYQIVERLGAGGMGEVYRAVHTYLGATRVIKVVRPQISASTDAHERFLREARAATKVQHPNVAVLHDFSALPDGSHYMVWEYIDGENLAQRLRTTGTLPIRQALAIAIQALQGLDAIHRAGIVHRDISPENLMITREQEVVKIIDLGVAKVDDPSETASTQTGIFVGKLRYASPEQLGFLPASERVDGRADIYAMGMVLYEMLTGRPPYEAKSPHEYFLLHAREPEHRVAQLPPELPAAAVLQALLDRALARDRNARFTRAAELAAALGEVERLIEAEQSSTTVVAELDGDATLKQITERYERPPTTGRAATTVRAAVTEGGTQRPSHVPIALVALVVVAVLGIGGYFFWPRQKTLPPPPAIESPILGTASQSTQPEETTQAPAESSVSVIAPPVVELPPLKSSAVPPETAGEVTRPVLALRTERPRIEKAERADPPPVKPPVVEQPASPPPAAEVPLYVDGGGDAHVNRTTILKLRDEVRGIRAVAVQGGGMHDQLVRSLKDHMPHLEISDSAPVVIRFEGTLERLGMGRKRREGHGTVSRDGRILFRYELPNEVFRVGMTPPDAFARILSDAFLP